MACDICGQTGKPLTSLRDSYQTAEVKDICYDCEKIVNRQHSKLLSMVLNILADLLKRFITEKRAKAVSIKGGPAE